MNKLKNLLPLLPVTMLSIIALNGCSNDEGKTRVLHILNSEDYIYEFDDTDPVYIEDEMDERSMIEQFIDYVSPSWKEKTGEDIEVIYDTFDTNETMFNELQTGKSTYDVIIPSDYMIQKLLSNHMLHPFSNEESWEYIPAFLRNKFENIFAEPLDENGESYNAPIDEWESIFKYSVPYMWGTLGLMYNPEKYISDTFTEEMVHKAFEDWDSLYEIVEGQNLDENRIIAKNAINKTFSIKDSVRDTFAVCLVHSTPGFSELSNPSSDELKALFNKHDQETMARVKEDMLKLKASAYGFECDSGKTDMTTGKIGANLCWSGDATWAITDARPYYDKFGKFHDGKDLYYSIPTSCTYYDEEGNPTLSNGASNIWFDAMCMPENESSDELQYTLAELFVKFMSQPENAMQNCYCVGYTPAVAGDDMLEYMYECYDVRGSLDGELEEDTEYVEYDLSYFFNGTLSDENEGKAILYADPDYIGRELTAQYPSEEKLDYLAVMEDFGKQGNQELLDLWEQVRTNPLPTWAVVLIILEALGALSLGFYLISKKIIRKKLKENRI